MSVLISVLLGTFDTSYFMCGGAVKWALLVDPEHAFPKSSAAIIIQDGTCATKFDRVGTSWAWLLQIIS